MNSPDNPSHIVPGLLQRLSPGQRQYAMLALILVGGVSLLWLVFAFTDSHPKNGAARTLAGLPSAVTNIGVMPPGGQVNPVDQWVGTAGRKLAQYENEREEQGRLNKDRQAFETKTLQRFVDLEQKLTSAQLANPYPATLPQAPASLPPAPPTASTAMPPAAGLPPPPPPFKVSPAAALPGGVPNSPFPVPLNAAPPAPGITRITLADRGKSASSSTSSTSSTGTGSDASSAR